MKTLRQLQTRIKQAQGVTGTTAYRPKGGDEQKFMDKHEIEVTGDANGNDDEVFKGTKVNKVDREKEKHGYDAEKSMEVHEETEELDELSPATLKSYLKKAKTELGIHARNVGNPGRSAKDQEVANKSAAKRTTGATVAGKKIKMSNEETDQVDERTLSTGEMKKREDIVKGMKKGLKDFKKRYGADAKSVMYATATKMAKEDIDYNIQLLELFASLDEENKQFMIEMMDKGLEQEIFEYIKESESDNG